MPMHGSRTQCGARKDSCSVWNSKLKLSRASGRQTNSVPPLQAVKLVNQVDSHLKLDTQKSAGKDQQLEFQHMMKIFMKRDIFIPLTVKREAVRNLDLKEHQNWNA
jgi:hypothetical protein